MPDLAMVLAAGLGSRMRPLTDHLPKPLIEVAGRSLIDRAIDRLQEASVSKIIVNTSYKAQMLEAHLSMRTNLDITFSRENTPLETGGGIARALSHFNDRPFFVVNGDIIWLDGKEPALFRLALHWSEDLDALLLLHPVEKAFGYNGRGDFHINPAGELIRKAKGETAPYVYAGVQILHPRLFEDAPQDSFSLNLLYDKAMTASPQRIRAIVHDGIWLHVGDPDGLKLANAYLARP